MRFVSWSILIFILLAAFSAKSQTNAFDGRPWNVSSGNLSVSFIQRSPIGAFPETNFFEAAPSVESQVRLRKMGLVANEDYIAWGAVERQPGEWLWEQHDPVEKNLHAAGLKYVVYNWAHFPPVWLRDQKDKRTLMRCLEHGEETFYLSIFDPRTIEWYDHFYKNIHAHFGGKIDDIYACILGPYGEGNYPIRVPDWINMGHCHEGYWAADDHAVAAFQKAMKGKYSNVEKLNRAWGTAYPSFKYVRAPRELTDEKFKPTPAAFPTPPDKRRWLDFITWYHQAIIDFSEQSLKTVLKYYPREKVRLKPGGNYGSVNPLPWGTYCPAYAKMAKRYGVVLQPADFQGAVFGDKWVGTAYDFYNVPLCTEPAGDLDDKSFVRRMFSDASSGASQIFTYQFERHAPAIQKYVHLYTGQPGDTEIAVYCPTTLYRLGASLQLTIEGSIALRDLCEFDVLDELLITDGALTPRRYKTLILFQADIVDQPILEKFEKFVRAGGEIIMVGNLQAHNVEGEPWRGATKVKEITRNSHWPARLTPYLAQHKGFDGTMDGLWTCRRGDEVFVFNSTGKPVVANIGGQSITVEPSAIGFRKIHPKGGRAPKSRKVPRVTALFRSIRVRSSQNLLFSGKGSFSTAASG